MRVRYGRWSGTQDPFPHELTADDVLDEIGDDLLAGVSPSDALERLVQRGLRGRVSGLEDLRRRVEQARGREASRMGVDGPLAEVAERLEAIVGRERTALEYSGASDAGERLGELDDAPADIASRIAALERHRWEDGRAEREFGELVAELRRDVAEATFGRLAQALGSMDPADLERMGAMLAELNDLIAAADRGEDTTLAFADFKARYGDMLPGDPDTLEALLDELARRMAAMSRMLADLDPDQRAQLSAMASKVLGDMDLGFQADRLQRALRARHPELGWDQGIGAPPTGEVSGSLADTVDWVEHLQEFEDLARALGQDYPGARLEDVDEELLRGALGAEAARDLKALREIERILEQSGAVTRREGRLELTPRGVRTLGERMLVAVYRHALLGSAGSHDTARAGGEGEPTGTTRPFRFGDRLRLDIPRTINNAVLRRTSPGSRQVQLAPEDFELAEAEQRVRSATVLLLDMSFSMPLRGNWVPAKRLALALQALVASRFPEDRFYVVGFSDYARRLQSRDLLAAGWERVYGTNMEHAFVIARRLLAAHPGDEQQVIMVTDGEPTAHLEGQDAYFAWPPEPRTLRRTLAEAKRLARTGATLNVFLLDHDPGAAAFVEQMVRSYGGRIFYPDLDDLGSMVVRDFLRRRTA
jgi:uncharacterized protein with von Willebrand factor type A (vWA) domain